MTDLVFASVAWLIKAGVAVIIGLMVLRGLIVWLRINPFSWFAYQIRRATEGMLAPMRRNMFALQSQRDIAPVLLIAFVLIIAYFLLGLLDQLRMVTFYLQGGVSAILAGSVFQGARVLFGAAALGLIALLITSIIFQVIFSWIGVYGNWLARTCFRISEPVLGPFRRLIPPLGFLDISPLIALIVLSLLSAAVQTIIL